MNTIHIAGFSAYEAHPVVVDASALWFPEQRSSVGLHHRHAAWCTADFNAHAVCLDHNGIAGNVDFRCRSGIPSKLRVNNRGVWAGFHRLWLVIYPKDIVLAYFQRKQIRCAPAAVNRQ